MFDEKTKLMFESGVYYGFGWGIRNFEGIKAYGHYGGMNGFVGAITYIPNGEYFICFLTNDDNTPKIRITNDLVSIVQGKDIPLPADTKLINSQNKARQTTHQDQQRFQHLITPAKPKPVENSYTTKKTAKIKNLDQDFTTFIFCTFSPTTPFEESDEAAKRATAVRVMVPDNDGKLMS